MKRMFNIFVICFIVLCHACSEINNGVAKIQIPVGEDNNLIRLQDMVASTKIVQLESKDSAFVSQIKDVFITEDRIYLYDNQQMAVFMFDKQGKLLKKYKERGGAGHEYVDLYDWAYDGEYIYLLDYSKILVLDYDLNYQKTINTEKLITTEMYKGGDRIEVYNNELFIYDDNNRCVYSISKDATKMRHVLTDYRQCASILPLSANESVFHKVGNNLFIVPGRSDCIYGVTENGTELLAQIDYSDKEERYKILNSKLSKDFHTRSNNIPFSVHRMFEADTKLYMFFPGRGGSYVEVDFEKGIGCEYVGYRNGMVIESDHPFWDTMNDRYWFRYIELDEEGMMDPLKSNIGGIQLTNYHECDDDLFQFLVIYELK